MYADYYAPAAVRLPDLRDYQIDVTDRVRAAVRISSRVILQAETGAGKTHMALDLMIRAFMRGKRSLFIARGRKLVDQCSKQLTAHGVPHGVIMAGRGFTNDLVQVASKDTIASRCMRREVQSLPEARLVVVDECHETGQSGEWLDLLRRYNGSIVIGLTATPARPNGRGLGNVYGALVQAVPQSVLIRDGWVVPSRVFAPYIPNLQGVGIEHGDYVRKELAARMDRPSLVGDVVAHWKRLGEGRPTIVFACTIEHAMHLCESFNAAGIPAKHVDQETPDLEREDIIADLEAGRIKVITNVSVFRQGVDIPCLSCVVLVRPTRSFVLMRQAVGRAKRPFPGKTDCIVLDHAGAVYQHGLPDEDVEWTLGEGETIQDKRERELREGRRPEPICCKKCDAMFSGSRVCPACGAPVRQRVAKKVSVEDGRLVPVGQVSEVTWEQKQRHWHKILFQCARLGRSGSAARAMFHQKFKEWPSSELASYICFDDGSRLVKDIYPQYAR